MWDQIYLIIGLSCMSILSVVSEPLILAKRGLGFKEENIGKNAMMDLFIKMLYCEKCIGFWIGLAVSQNFLTACIVSISAAIIGKFVRGGKIS